MSSLFGFDIHHCIYIVGLMPELCAAALGQLPSGRHVLDIVVTTARMLYSDDLCYTILDVLYIINCIYCTVYIYNITCYRGHCPMLDRPFSSELRCPRFPFSFSSYFSFWPQFLTKSFASLFFANEASMTI